MHQKNRRRSFQNVALWLLLKTLLCNNWTYNRKKYIHKLHFLTTPCSTLISVRKYEEKEWKCVHVSFELVWLDSSLIQHQSPHILAKSFLDSHQKTEWHKTGSSKTTWVMTSRLLYLSLNFSFSCFTNKQSWEAEALASHISYKSKLWL